MEYLTNLTDLVRFGGAGAVLPFLFVVLRICTLTLLPPVENVDNFDEDVPRSGCVLFRFYFRGNNLINFQQSFLPDGAVLLSECVLIWDFFPINGVEFECEPPCNCFSTASVIEDSCQK